MSSSDRREVEEEEVERRRPLRAAEPNDRGSRSVYLSSFQRHMLRNVLHEWAADDPVRSGAEWLKDLLKDLT